MGPDRATVRGPRRFQASQQHLRIPPQCDPPPALRASRRGPPTSRRAPARRSNCRLPLGGQRVDHLVEAFALDQPVERVERQVDAVVGHAVLAGNCRCGCAASDRPSRPGSAAAAALMSASSRCFCFRRRERSSAIALARFLCCERSVLAAHHDAGRQCVMRIGGFGLVDVLAAGAAGAHRLDLEILASISTSTSPPPAARRRSRRRCGCAPAPRSPGTRCTRCTPLSNFSLAKAPRPTISAMISL